MKKEKLRFLALGFFLSALILSAFQLISPSASAQNEADVEDVAQKTEDYQKKYESLMADHEQLLSEIKNESSHEPAEEEKNEATETESEIVAEVTDVDSTHTTPAPSTFVFLIHEGQPSSLVLQNLLEAGLIDSVESAEAYLTEQDLITSIQFGSYTLSKDMSDAEVLNTITAQ